MEERGDLESGELAASLTLAKLVVTAVLSVRRSTFDWPTQLSVEQSKVKKSIAKAPTQGKASSNAVAPTLCLFTHSVAAEQHK